jgi:outer membrane protein assembly factor BamD
MPEGLILTDRPASRTATAATALMLMLLMLTACATVPADREAPASAADLYDAGATALETGDYPAAIRYFQRLEALFPNDRHATQGQMELVYAYYQEGDASSAVAAAGRFIRQYPDHPNLDYLYYLRGLARFDQALRDLSALTSTTGPRPPTVDLAMQYFGELIFRFPQSRYSDDARSRVAHLRQQLAQFELDAAKQHMNRGEYTSAGLRARSVIEHYPDTGLATEAATIVNMANRMLKLEGAIPDDTPPVPLAPGGAEASPAPAPAPGVPVAVNPPDAAPDGQPRSEDWILRQDGEAWTIQLFGTGNEQALLSFIDRHGLDEAALFRSTRNEGPWFTLIYGVYRDTDAARAAAERLPRIVLGEQPWIRKLSAIQAIIELEALERAHR